MTGPYRADTDRANRLHAARKAAGFRSAREAAVRFGWPPKTYQAHETANLFFDEPTGKAYAEAFRVSPAWLYHGRGKGPPVDEARRARFDLRIKAAVPPELGPAGRLRAARRLAGYRSTRDAAAAVGTNRTTLAAHEAGQNQIPRAAAIRYGHAFAVEPEWLLSGKPPSGLPREAEAELQEILKMHRNPEGQAFARFGHLARKTPPELRIAADEPSGGGRSAPATAVDGDVVREYSPRALFLKLVGEPGALHAASWTLPKGYLVQIYGCDPATTVLVSVPEPLPRAAAGARLLIDTGVLEPPEALVAIVSEDGRLVLARYPEEVPSHALSIQERLAGPVKAYFGPLP